MANDFIAEQRARVERAREFAEKWAGRGLISFDLAMVETTRLPAVAHDLMLVRPIEGQAFHGIAQAYAHQKKQGFLTIDKISRYSAKTSPLTFCFVSAKCWTATSATSAKLSRQQQKGAIK